MRASDERDRVHARRGAGVLAEQLEAGQVDQYVREQVRAVEEDARELRHDLARALDAWR